ncbi:MAG: hypothetical protein KGJ21_07615 [Pseudomonadota bacterium]|nr:hypothetical protein [Pseudomonadota bacterium]
MENEPDCDLYRREEDAFKIIAPKIKEFADYAIDIYNLAFALEKDLYGQPYGKLPDIAETQLIILLRITDYLRAAVLLATRGYIDQAGTLGASIFELAHTALYFSSFPEERRKWWNSTSLIDSTAVKEEMPKLLGKTWYEIVLTNVDGDKKIASKEYNIYRQLCWMKHSLPQLVSTLRINWEKKTVSLVSAPYYDETAIYNGSFVLFHISKLAELVIQSLVTSFDTKFSNELEKLAPRSKNLAEKLASKNYETA